MKTCRGPCPKCDRGPLDTALAVTVDDRGTVAYCHRCGYTAAQLTELHASRIQVGKMPVAHSEPQGWSDSAGSVWHRTQPLRGSLAAAYLLGRGCLLPPPDGHLRYLPPAGGYSPAMVALISDAITAEPISLHFTELKPDGSGRGQRRLLAGHRKRGGVIRLWSDDHVTYGLAVAEGIETALAAAHLQSPVWSTIDAGNLAAMPVLAGIDALTIYADHDDAGMHAAQECGRRWLAEHREARILRSRILGHDIADEVAAWKAA